MAQRPLFQAYFYPGAGESASGVPKPAAEGVSHGQGAYTAPTLAGLHGRQRRTAFSGFLNGASETSEQARRPKGLPVVDTYTHSHGQTRLFAFGDQREPARATLNTLKRIAQVPPFHGCALRGPCGMLDLRS